MSILLHKKNLAVLFIFTINWLAYANSFENEFVFWDDQTIIVNNHDLRSLSPAKLIAMFTFSSGATYQPIRTLSYAIDYYFFQSDPRGYHFQNILFHGMAAVFLFLTLNIALPQIYDPRIQWLDAAKSPSFPFFLALFAATLFSIHPLSTEAVTWLSGRKYTLLAFFAFLSFYYFVRSTQSQNPYRDLAIAYITSVGSILSSPFGCILPGLFFLYDYCRDHETSPLGVIKKRWGRYLPYLISALLLTFPIMLNIIGNGDGKGQANIAHFRGNPIYTFYSFCYAAFNYGRNIVLPLWLNNRYPDYIPFTFWGYKTVIGCLGIVSLLAFAIRQACYRSKFDLFWIGWIFITWFPAMSLFIPIPVKMADRYFYLTQIGFFTGVGFYLIDLLSRAGQTQSKRFTLLFIGMVIPLLSLTFARNQIWRNTETLWLDSLQKDPKNTLANYNLAHYYENQNQFLKAIPYYRQAIATNPECRLTAGGRIDSNCYAALNGLGNTYLKAGMVGKAIAAFQNAIRGLPDQFKAQYHLGNAYTQNKAYDKARTAYMKALKISPKDPKAGNNLGLVLERLGRLEDAAKQYAFTIANNPQFYETYINYGMLWYRSGNPTKALELCQKALAIHPVSAEAHNNLGIILDHQHRYDQALTHYQKALQIKPDFMDAYYNMGNLFLRREQLAKAIEAYQKALQLNPKHAELCNNLGIALAGRGRFQEAYDYFQKAIQLKPEFRDAQNNLDRVRQLR